MLVYSNPYAWILSTVIFIVSHKCVHFPRRHNKKSVSFKNERYRFFNPHSVIYCSFRKAQRASSEALFPLSHP